MGLLVTVLGTHAGVGTTTLAVNLAAALADDGPNAVRLVELDETLGHLAGRPRRRPARRRHRRRDAGRGLRGSGDAAPSDLTE